MEHITKLVTDWKQGKRNENWCISLRDFIIRELITYSEVENIFFPVKIDKNLIQFTNYYLSSPSGYNIYLVYISGKKQFYKTYYEIDCDGCYWVAYEMHISDILENIEDFKIHNNLRVSELLKLLESFIND